MKVACELCGAVHDLEVISGVRLCGRHASDYHAVRRLMQLKRRERLIIEGDLRAGRRGSPGIDVAKRA